MRGRGRRSIEWEEERGRAGGLEVQVNDKMCVRCDRGRCGLCFTHPLEKKKQKGRRPPLISLGIFSSFCVVHFYQSTYLQNVIPCKAMLIVVGAWIGPAARNGQLLCLSHIVRTFRVCILTFCFFFSKTACSHFKT